MSSSSYEFLEPFLPPSLASSSSPPSSCTNATAETLPHVTLTYASSLDSCLSLSPGKPTKLSGPESKILTHYLRSRHDAILVGVGTAVADDPGLNCRLHELVGQGQSQCQGKLVGAGHPRPVVLDPRSRWQVHRQSRVIRTAHEGAGQGPWVLCSSAAEMPEERRAVIEQSGGRVLRLPMEGGDTARWRDILRVLADQGVASVMIEGGATVINELLGPDNARLVSSVVVTVAPVFLGQGSVSVRPPRTVADDDDDDDASPVPVARLRHVVWQPLGEDVILCGRLG